MINNDFLVDYQPYIAWSKVGTSRLRCVVTDQMISTYKRFSHRWLDRLYIQRRVSHCLGWRVQSGEPDCFVRARFNLTTTAPVIGHWSGSGYCLLHSENPISALPRSRQSVFLPSRSHRSLANVQHTSSSSTTYSPRSQLYTRRPSSDCHCKPCARSPSTSGSRDLIAIDDDGIIRKCAESFRGTVLLFWALPAWFRVIGHSR